MREICLSTLRLSSSLGGRELPANLSVHEFAGPRGQQRRAWSRQWVGSPRDARCADAPA